MKETWVPMGSRMNHFTTWKTWDLPSYRKDAKNHPPNLHSQLDKNGRFPILDLLKVVGNQMVVLMVIYHKIFAKWWVVMVNYHKIFPKVWFNWWWFYHGRIRKKSSKKQPRVLWVFCSPPPALYSHYSGSIQKKNEKKNNKNQCKFCPIWCIGLKTSESS